MAFSFSPELHKSIKNELNHNVGVITSLLNQEGRKLVFNLSNGRFSTENDGFKRTVGNIFKSNGTDSATNQNCFEFPLLITFYEMQKLALKIDNGKKAREGKKAYDNRLPVGSFKACYEALLYLRDTTYRATNKNAQRLAITNICMKADKLENSTTQPQLDRHLAEWIPFVIPADIRSMVIRSIQMVKGDPDLIRIQKFKNFPDGGIAYLGGFIYRKIYKTGGASSGANSVNPHEKKYAENIKTILPPGIKATLQNSQFYLFGSDHFTEATLDNFIDGEAYKGSHLCDSIGFLFFDSGKWFDGEALARVYIHFRYDDAGSIAVAGLKKIFNYLEVTLGKPEDALILQKFCSFKICSLKMLHRCADSVVMYFRDMVTARKFATELVGPLQGLVTDPLPMLVKNIAAGIGISTEPENSFDPRFSSLGPEGDIQYSYGTHRCGLIAKGLISARGVGHVLPNDDICFKHVALAFSDAGVEFMKPYHTGSLPSLRVNFNLVGRYKHQRQ
jgi:HopA1 effector protein family